MPDEPLQPDPKPSARERAEKAEQRSGPAAGDRAESKAHADAEDAERDSGDVPERG